MVKQSAGCPSEGPRYALMVLALFLWAGIACGRTPAHEAGAPAAGSDTPVAESTSGVVETPVPGAGPVMVTLPPLAPVPATPDPILPVVSIPRQELRPAVPALPEPGRYELEFPPRTTENETAVIAGAKPGEGKPAHSRSETKLEGTPLPASTEEPDTGFVVQGAAPLPPGRDWQILVGITPPVSLDGYFVFGLEYIAGISDVKDRAFSETPELWH